MSEPRALSPGQDIDAGLRLLDRQILDADGLPAGKVDDLELTVPDGGGPPVVTALLSGPLALAPRIGGRLGWWYYAINRRLRPGDDERPRRIPLEHVIRVDSAVHVDLPRSALEQRLEEWFRENVIERIPGSAGAHG